jgi:hypothetical protein
MEPDRAGDFQSTRSAAPVSSRLRPRRRLMILLSALMLAAAPLHAQQAPPAPPHQHGNLDNAVREMGGDARMKKMSDDKQLDLVEFVAGNLLFVGFHELGHAVIGELRLPVLGREEDAADSFATLALLEEGTDFTVNVLVQAARGWFLMDRRDQKTGDTPDFYDAHGLDQQRAYSIVCLMVGSDEKQFKDLADWVQLPKDRQQTCKQDYEGAKYAWNEVLKPHLRALHQTKSKIDVVYDTVSGKLDTYYRSFRSIGFLETLADYASLRFVLPRPIGIVMKSCGDTNAWWDPPTLKETLCYEMADDFVELYRGYREKIPQKKMQANQLLALNVKRIRLEHAMSMASVASALGLPKAWVSRVERGLENTRADQLDKLALALKVEPASFFEQPGSGASKTADAKPRARK